MTKKLGPEWSKEDQAAGEQRGQAWEKFFSDGERRGRQAQGERLGEEEARLADVRSRHEASLLRYPNVVAVSDGVRTKRGTPTEERCVVVYVTRKIPRTKLAKEAILPRTLEGIRVDVVEVGAIEPLTT
jgi:hypothetical protein